MTLVDGLQRIERVDADFVQHVDLAAQHVGPRRSHRRVRLDDDAIDRRLATVVVLVRQQLRANRRSPGSRETDRCRTADSGSAIGTSSPSSRNVERRFSTNSSSRSDTARISCDVVERGPRVTGQLFGKGARDRVAVTGCPSWNVTCGLQLHAQTSARRRCMSSSRRATAADVPSRANATSPSRDSRRQLLAETRLRLPEPVADPNPTRRTLGSADGAAAGDVGAASHADEEGNGERARSRSLHQGTCLVGPVAHEGQLTSD